MSAWTGEYMGFMVFYLWFLSDFLIWYLSPYLMVFCWFLFCIYEGCKEITVKRRQEKKTGVQLIFLYFDLISGFSNHSVGGKIIPESKLNGCVS